MNTRATNIGRDKQKVRPAIFFKVALRSYPYYSTMLLCFADIIYSSLSVSFCVLYQIRNLCHFVFLFGIQLQMPALEYYTLQTQPYKWQAFHKRCTLVFSCQVVFCYLKRNFLYICIVLVAFVHMYIGDVGFVWQKLPHDKGRCIVHTSYLRVSKIHLHLLNILSAFQIQCRRSNLPHGIAFHC